MLSFSLVMDCFVCVLQAVIVKLKMDKDRKRILERKAMTRAKAMADKGKYTEETMETS